MNNLEQPVIDIEKINKAANEAAEKAYLNAISDFYTGYNSPYKKMIHKELEKQSMPFRVQIPNIMNTINNGIKAEVDRIANAAIQNSFIPKVSEFFTDIPKNLTLHQFFEMIIEAEEPDSKEYDEYDYSIESGRLFDKDDKYGYRSLIFDTKSGNFNITLYCSYSEYRKEPEGEPLKYHLIGIPEALESRNSNRKMSIKKDDITIEMPYLSGCLDNDVMSILTRMALNETQIELSDFDFEEYFDNKRQLDGCDCY